MGIFKKIFEKIKSLFTKKEEIAMLDIGKETSDEKQNKFKEEIKVKIEKVFQKKKVETQICYGDGLGISKKMEY